jgi:hypothetical protein
LPDTTNGIPGAGWLQNGPAQEQLEGVPEHRAGMSQRLLKL